MAKIRITATIEIDEDTLEERFVLASGPGGQNVNKVASAVQLRFDMRAAALPDDVQARLEALAGTRLTKDSAILITARRFRDQQRNREDARARLIELIRAATRRPKPRKATRPTRASKERRLEGKKQRGRIKQGRSGKIEL